MSEDVLSIDIDAPPSAVFATLADLGGYGRWLAHSSSYRGTTASAGSVETGAYFSDTTPLERLDGTVVECWPDSLLVFRQATERNDFAVTIRYELTPYAGGTRLVRTGVITTAGRLRLVLPIVVAATKAENRRTLRALKEHLEAGTPTDQSSVTRR